MKLPKGYQKYHQGHRKHKPNWRKIIKYLAIFAIVGLLVLALYNNSRNAPDPEQRIFAEVNAYRTENGLQPLERNAFMDELAREHCRYLVENGGIPYDPMEGWVIAHKGFTERAEKIKNTLGATDASENVAVGPDPVGSWQYSNPHNSNLLNPKWTHTGIGVAGNYTCMIFSD